MVIIDKTCVHLSLLIENCHLTKLPHSGSKNYTNMAIDLTVLDFITISIYERMNARI